MGTNRRLLLRRIFEGLVGLGGVAISLKWVERGLVDNSGVTAAARTFNQAIDEHRKGRSTLRDAHSAFERENWLDAEELYDDAHAQYYEAANRYRDARDVAHRTECDALADAAERYRTYCRRMEDACSAWATAADLRARGEVERAKAQRSKGDDLRRRALESIEKRIPNERNVSNPNC